MATTASSASGSSPTASRAPSCLASAARPGSASRPVTCQPRARRPRPTEPPMRPVPTTRARRAAPASAGEVIAEPLGAVEVDVAQLVAASGWCTCNRTRTQRGMDPATGISAAQSRGTAPKPMPRAAVAGNIETTSAVAVKMMLMTSSSTRSLRAIDLGQQLLDALGHLLDGVLVDRGGAAHGSHGGGSGIGRHATSRRGRPSPGVGSPRPAGRRGQSERTSAGVSGAPPARGQGVVARAGRSGCAPAGAPGGPPPGTCGGPGGCGPRG